MKAKTTLVPGAQSPDLVAKGEVELGIAQASEIVPVAGTQLVGPLPGEIGSLTLFTGGIGAESGISGCGEGADRIPVRARGRAALQVKGIRAGALKTDLSSSWPGLSRPSASFLRLWSKDVDARLKAGHDELNSHTPRAAATASAPAHR